MQLKKIGEELRKAKAELEARMERTHKHTYHRDEPVSANFSEQIKQTENDTLVMALEEEGKDELRLINKALQRLKSGDYLKCESCGGSIGEQRLNALPHADQCITCASVSG